MPLAAAAEPVRPPPVEKAPAAAPVAAAPEPKPAKISQVSPGVLISRVNPQYPPAARAARVQGAVVMHAVIGTDGTIQQLRVISGNPLLVNAAMAAVKQWRYRPYLLGGTPVEGETDITVNFKGE
jgi:periplasmic protein TonB